MVELLFVGGVLLVGNATDQKEGGVVVWVWLHPSSTSQQERKRKNCPRAGCVGGRVAQGLGGARASKICYYDQIRRQSYLLPPARRVLAQLTNATNAIIIALLRRVPFALCHDTDTPGSPTRARPMWSEVPVESIHK